MITYRDQYMHRFKNKGSINITQDSIHILYLDLY